MLHLATVSQDQKHFEMIMPWSMTTGSILTYGYGESIPSEPIRSRSPSGVADKIHKSVFGKFPRVLVSLCRFPSVHRRSKYFLLAPEARTHMCELSLPLIVATRGPHSPNPTYGNSSPKTTNKDGRALTLTVISAKSPFPSSYIPGGAATWPHRASL